MVNSVRDSLFLVPGGSFESRGIKPVGKQELIKRITDFANILSQNLEVSHPLRPFGAFPKFEEESKPILSENLLGIPKESCGLTGIRTGNTISQELKKLGYKAEFNADTKKIIVLDSSNLDPSILTTILYKHTYEGWFPHVESERNPEKNVIITLKSFVRERNPREKAIRTLMDFMRDRNIKLTITFKVNAHPLLSEPTSPKEDKKELIVYWV